MLVCYFSSFDSFGLMSLLTCAKVGLEMAKQIYFWLPVRQRIDYKIAMLTFQSLGGSAPKYLSDLITRYRPTRTLRSSQSHSLRTLIPAHHRSFAPKWQTSMEDRDRIATELKEAAIERYNKNARPLP